MEVTLRPLTEEDLEFLLEVRNDETTRSMLEADQVFTLEECKLWFKYVVHKWYIIENDEGERVGYFRVFEDQVGCDIHPNYRRKGYARSAYTNYLKDKTFTKLWVFNDNFAKQLYLSLGFKENGNFKIIRNRKYIEMIWKS